MIESNTAVESINRFNIADVGWKLLVLAGGAMVWSYGMLDLYIRA